MRKKENKEENTTDARKKRKTGAYCVYFCYKQKGCEDIFPQIITYGSEDQCKKHVSDYNRQTLEDNRCKLYVGRSEEIICRIGELKKKYGVVSDEYEN